MKEDFQKAYRDFQNEYTYELRNSGSFRNDIGDKIFKLGGGRFDEAIRIIIKGHGERIKFAGEKAIELFINYLKLYNIKEIDKDDLKIALDYLNQQLIGIAESARHNAESYHASKGGSTFVYMNLDVLWVGQELELRIPAILDKLRIEVRKFLIENKPISESNLSNVRIKFYYIDEDYYKKIISGEQRVNLGYETDIFVELINKYDMDNISGYILARGGYHTHDGIRHYGYSIDFRNNKPGYFTSDGKVYYKITGFLDVSDNIKGKVVLVNLKKEHPQTATNEKIYLAGENYDAIKGISSLALRAKKSIILIDNYIDEGVLNLFEDKPKDLELKILTKNLKPRIETFAKKFNSQYNNLSLRTSPEFHDRFLIIDENEFYSLGASIKDVGNKTTMYSRLQDKNETSKLHKHFNEVWGKANKII